MLVKQILGKIYASRSVKKFSQWIDNPEQAQQQVFNNLVKNGRNTLFGKDHHFEKIKTYTDFKNQVPIRDYEALIPYINKIKQGEPDILWPGKPLYFCKTSGTTSGAKYIPISNQSMSNHTNGAKMALLNYISVSGNSKFLNGKIIFLQGSPILDQIANIPTGRLSGIVAHHVPGYLQKNRMPTYKTNCIEDWETKVDAIVDETIKEDMTLISGIPAWMQMYFEKIKAKSDGKAVTQVFKNLSLIVYGGVNFEPYRNNFNQLLGKTVDLVETYPASEGFMAFQDRLNQAGLLLILDQGIFYEFIKADNFFNENPERISLTQVELNVNYALILNTNAGLWGYAIGDTVKFISLAPYRIVVTGRIKHFTSAFGEHVIAEEVESALAETLEKSKAVVQEFHVAPQVNPTKGELPYHQWFIEFTQPPKNLNAFAEGLDELMQLKNPYYFDLIKGKVLQPLKITAVKKDGFLQLMKNRGKLGGQNKIPRLANDRTLAKQLEQLS